MFRSIFVCALAFGCLLVGSSPALAAPPPYYPPIDLIPAASSNYDVGRTAAQLVCAIARRYNIPTDRDHIVGHNELPGNDHSDPGPYWNWTYYMSLVRSCSEPRAQALSRGGVNTLADHSYVPAAGLEQGTASGEVALLQWDLVYLGFMSADDLSDGSGTFGPLTLAALTAFQEANGVPATGTYGDLTAPALAQ